MRKYSSCHKSLSLPVLLSFHLHLGQRSPFPGAVLGRDMVAMSTTFMLVMLLLGLSVSVSGPLGTQQLLFVLGVSKR